MIFVIKAVPFMRGQHRVRLVLADIRSMTRIGAIVG